MPKLIEFDDSVAVGGVTPVPVKLTVCVVGFASSVNVRVAAKGLAEFGVNVRFTMHVLCAATVEPFVQVVPAATANSPAFVPPSATVVRFSVSVPPFVNVSVSGELVVFII